MEMKSLKKSISAKPKPNEFVPIAVSGVIQKMSICGSLPVPKEMPLAIPLVFFADGGEKIDSQPPARFLLFPPTKETTGLNFVIHAPFLLNESREGIRAGAQHNRKMIGLLAELAADSLSYLKQIGIEKGVRLLGENLFDIVPYDESIFSPLDDVDQISFAPPFYHLIQRVLMEKELLPAEGGGYVAAKNAYWPLHAPLAAVFSNEQLAWLCKNPRAKWVFAFFGHYEAGRAGGGGSTST